VKHPRHALLRSILSQLTCHHPPFSRYASGVAKNFCRSSDPEPATAAAAAAAAAGGGTAPEPSGHDTVGAVAMDAFGNIAAVKTLQQKCVRTYFPKYL